MNYNIEYEPETDGRWIAEATDLPGVLAYGATADEAMAKAEALALRVLAERLETAESGPAPISIAFSATRPNGVPPWNFVCCAERRHE